MLPPRTIDVPPIPEPHFRVIQVAEAHEAPEPTIEEKIDTVARETGIASSTLYSLIFHESTLNPAVPDIPIPPTQGCPNGSFDRGVAQINSCYHAEVTDAQAHDVDFSLQWAANIIKKDEAWKTFTECNCYTYVKTLVGDLPAFKDIQSNSVPVKGSLAIFDYHGVKHVAYVKSIDPIGFDVKEANFKPCGLDSRHISWGDPALKGFYLKPSDFMNPKEP